MDAQPPASRGAPNVLRAVSIGVVIAGLFVALGSLSTEAAMDPTPADRWSAGIFFFLVGVVAAAAVFVLPRVAGRLGVKGTVALVAAIGPAVVVLATLAGAASMFLSDHDTRVLFLLIGAGTACAAISATAVATPLVRDLARLRRSVDRVAAGELDVETDAETGGEVANVSGAFDDLVGQLRAAEAEREAAEHERNVVLASISHDLRTPLTALRAALEAVQDGVSPDPDRYLASMGKDLDAVDELVDNLFLLGRLEAGRYEMQRVPVRLAELADEAVEALTPVAARREVTLRASVDPAIVVDGGPAELSRVLRNLLDNAIRHSPGGSTVAVEVCTDDGRPTVRVTDEGPGFPDDFREVAFERFRRADEARARATGGAGLGLAIARGVVEAHGGRIWADAGPGGRVSFTLPSAVPA